MSGHVEGAFEAFCALTIGSEQGPFVYRGHQLRRFMDALTTALERVSFKDPVTGEIHRVAEGGAIVHHVGPTLGSLQFHLEAAARFAPGDRAIGDFVVPARARGKLAQARVPRRRAPARRKGARKTR